MPTSNEIRVSVDIGYTQHSVAIGLSSGERVEEFEIRHRPEGFAEFFSRIESIRSCHGGSENLRYGIVRRVSPSFSAASNRSGAAMAARRI